MGSDTAGGNAFSQGLLESTASAAAGNLTEESLLSAGTTLPGFMPWQTCSFNADLP